MAEYFVAHRERALRRHLRIHDRQELVVRDDDECVHFLLEVGEAALRYLFALRALEGEGLRHDGDHERADFLRDLRDDRRGAGAGAAAHTAGDEHHIASRKRLLHFLARLFRRPLAEVRVHTGAEAAREVLADVELALRERAVQVLRVGVHSNEFNIAYLRVDHMVHGVAAAATDADDADACEGLYFRLDALGHWIIA